jgi:selenocysteine lyase/cysteine desulfurase
VSVYSSIVVICTLQDEITRIVSSVCSKTNNISFHSAIDVGTKPDNIIYFNTSGKTALPRSVQRAGEQAVGRECRPWEPQTSCTEEKRSQFAHMVQASSDDIAIVPSITDFAITMFANNIFRGSSGERRR